MSEGLVQVGTGRTINSISPSRLYADDRGPSIYGDDLTSLLLRANEGVDKIDSGDGRPKEAINMACLRRGVN